MKTPKFKKGDYGYLFNKGFLDPFSDPGINVSANEIYVTEVQGWKVKGFTVQKWRNIKHLHVNTIKSISFDKLTNAKISKMEDHNSVRLSHNGKIDDLLTKEELKIEMIKWIANDFSDPNDTSHLHP